MNNTTALMALKIDSDKRFDLFRQCLVSFYSVLKEEHVLIHVAIDGSDHYRKRIFDLFTETKLPITIIEGGGFVKAIRNLISSVTTPYFFFMLDDVELLNNKNFIKPAIKAFSMDPKLIQVKFGGGKVDSKTKATNLKSLQEQYLPLEIENDIIWYSAIANDKEEYIISQYNSIMRTQIFKDINDRIFTNPPTWDAYTVFIVKNFREELNKYNSGWLNFEDYLYCWGRAGINLSEAYSLLKTGK